MTSPQTVDQTRVGLVRRTWTSWSSVAAGIGVLGFSFAPMLEPTGTTDPPPGCSAWSVCPGQASELPIPPFYPDGTELRGWLVAAIVAAAVVVPVLVALGVLRSPRARRAQVIVSAAALAGCVAYFTLMYAFHTLDWRDEWPWLYSFRPDWGGWAILALTAVMVLCAIAIGRQPKPIGRRR